jgi:pyruvate dehydrogenase (quinone)
LVKYNLPVKVIIIKNNVLGMIKWEQIAFEGNPQFGVELQPIDFSAISRACGAAGYTIEKPDEAEAILRAALTHPGPAVIEAVVDPTEPPLPGHITTAQAWNFVKALARGQEDRWQILKTAAKNTVRQVI